MEVPKQRNEVRLQNFSNGKVLTKLEAKMPTKTEAKVLTKTEAELNGSTMGERLLLPLPPGTLRPSHRKFPSI